MSVKEEGYKRCGTCNYCPLDNGDLGYTFAYDKKEDQYICSKCTSDIGSALSEFGYSEDEEANLTAEQLIARAAPGNSWRSEKETGEQKLKRNLGINVWKDRLHATGTPNPSGVNGSGPKKITLPGITGVNEGPKIDLDKDS